MIVLPFVPSVPDQQFTVLIGSSDYRIRALWNGRLNLWHMSVAEADGTPIATGIAIVLGTFLGRTSTHPLFEGGAFIVRSKTNSEVDAGLDDLGSNVEVRYYTLDEFVAHLAIGA